MESLTIVLILLCVITYGCSFFKNFRGDASGWYWLPIAFGTGGVMTVLDEVKAETLNPDGAVFLLIALIGIALISSVEIIRRRM